jgi:tRNA A37 threonylcarbamoyladenosine dehydratase
VSGSQLVMRFHTRFFDRQVRAFGTDVQKLLKRLRIGMVGVGGTGSAVAEQIIRLGVGSVLAADGEAFEASKVNRVAKVLGIDVPASLLARADEVIE